MLLVRALLALGLLLACASARGQSNGSDAASAELADAELEALVARAVAAYDAGDLASARALFEAVHRRQPTARTLRSLGLVAVRQERLSDAVALLEAALASQVKPLTAAQREGAQTLLGEARAKLAAQPELASGDAQASAPALPDVAAAAGASASVAAGEAQVAPVSAPASAAAGEASAPAPAERPTTRTRRLRRARYGLLGAGAGALLFGFASYLTGVIRVQSIEDACKVMPDGRCYASDVAQRQEDAKLVLLEKLALGGLITGGAAIAAGAVMFVWRPAADRASAELGVAYRGRF